MQAILKELLQNQSDPSISLILATNYNAFDGKRKVRIAIKNGIHTIEKQLQEQYPRSIAKPICQTLHQLASQIDLQHPPQSVGLFIAHKYGKYIPLPFPVTQKAVVSDTFEIQDLLYNLDKSIAYYVVHLSKKHTRFFKGTGTMLQEMQNDDFPQSFQDEYQKSRSSPYALHTNDPSQVEQRHLEDFLRQISHLIATYVHKDPLILIGIDKYISYYKKVENAKSIIGELHANHDQLATHQIAKLIWPIVAEYQEKEEKKLIQNLLEKIERTEAVNGIDAVLQNFNQRSHHLVIERDFEIPGYLYQDQLGLTQFPQPAKAIPNVIEHLVEKILRKKNGQINIVAPNALKKQGRIVLVTH